MKKILPSNFLDFFFIIMPIWILPLYYLSDYFIDSKKLVFLIFLLIFAETHFGSTFLFFFNKKNLDYAKNNFIKFFITPAFLIIFYIFIAYINFDLALIIAAIASGIHVTRQSIGVQRLFGNKRSIIFENITYFTSFLFLIIGFVRFYLNDFLVSFNFENLIPFDKPIDTFSFKLFFIVIIISFCFVAFSEKTNIKKKFSNVTGVLIYAPYLLVDSIYDAMIIGVGAHWCQYLAINYKVYFYNQKINSSQIKLIMFIILYSIIMVYFGSKFHMSDRINYLILIPLIGQIFHYYTDAFIWKFSDPYIRENIGKKLFS